MAARNGATLAATTHAQLEQLSPDSIEGYALNVFGSKQKAEKWLNRPRTSLHGLSPRQHMRSGPDGLREVLKRLTAIDYGIYS